jgi:hypothetical protein
MRANSPGFAAIAICLESDSKPLVQFIAFNIRIYFTVFKNVLEIFSCVSQPRATCNIHVVYCASKSYQLSEQTGSNQLYFSDEILSLHNFNEVYAIMLHIVTAAVLAACNNLTDIPAYTP